MIQLLTGENNYEIRSRRTRTIAEFRETHSEEAVSIVDGANLTREELPQLLLGANLFAPERLVVIDDANSVKDTWEKLTDYLGEVSDMTHVLLVTPTADKRTKTYKWLQKTAKVIAPNKLDNAQLSGWLQTRAREKGISIDPGVARYIIEYSEADQWQLSHDVDKLALSGRVVTKELVRELLIPNPTSSAFELLDAALNGRREQMNALLEGVRSHEDPYRFFGLLSNQIFAIVVVAAAGNRSPDTIASDSGIHPFVVRKIAPLARKLNVSARNHLAEVAATTDMQLKTSGADPWMLITAALKSISSIK